MVGRTRIEFTEEQRQFIVHLFQTIKHNMTTVIPNEYEKRFRKTSYATLKREFQRISDNEPNTTNTGEESTGMASNIIITRRAVELQSGESQVMPSISSMSISSISSSTSVSKKAGRPKEIFAEEQKNLICFLFQTVKENVTRNIPEQFANRFGANKSYNTLKAEYDRLMRQMHQQSANSDLPTTSAAANYETLPLKRDLSDLSYNSHLPDSKKFKRSSVPVSVPQSRSLFQQEAEPTGNDNVDFQDGAEMDGLPDQDVLETGNNTEHDETFLPDNVEVNDVEEIDNENLELQIEPYDNLVATHRSFRNADLNRITYLNNGINSSVCRFCNAKNFSAEINTRLKSYSICCANGKVTLPGPREDQVIKSLLMPNNQRSNLRNTIVFKHYIRVFNNLLAFASLNVESVRPNPQTGVYAYKIHGQLYHHISTLHPNPNQSHRYAQLYIIDSNLALQERLNMV
jgi:hypothetical protein